VSAAAGCGTASATERTQPNILPKKRIRSLASSNRIPKSASHAQNQTAMSVQPDADLACAAVEMTVAVRGGRGRGYRLVSHLLQPPTLVRFAGRVRVEFVLHIHTPSTALGAPAPRRQRCSEAYQPGRGSQWSRQCLRGHRAATPRPPRRAQTALSPQCPPRSGLNVQKK
jgi:hypothetical protein